MSTDISTDTLDHPRTRAAFRTVTTLVGVYLAVSVLALGAVVLMRDDATEVTSTVWSRAVVVVVTAGLLLVFTGRAARGSRGAYRRLRIVSVVTPVAIAVLVAIPGALPTWMRVEQAVCGAVMIAVAVLVNGAHLRGVFTRR